MLLVMFLHYCNKRARSPQKELLHALQSRSTGKAVRVRLHKGVLQLAKKGLELSLRSSR